MVQYRTFQLRVEREGPQLLHAAERRRERRGAGVHDGAQGEIQRQGLQVLQAAKCRRQRQVALGAGDTESEAEEQQLPQDAWRRAWCGAACSALALLSPEQALPPGGRNASTPEHGRRYELRDGKQRAVKEI